eukprot:CAMPEP_0206183018 /NCGR_PEP_ID=MMETSP0166-20121206/396_1 /ASSEMBLY_ACC=CAM_ASM_000260 /TAXON_ID=95228 /ORGANISM="Vannella robusta, Strain DIVA3 518/3/11/1/6" /LENGTH=211 /DNA_ID=CAMNT_0053597809 /DNA_START=56 /DNA_END=692 /DNA_ORIENTATION=+
MLLLASKAIRNQAAADNEQITQKNISHEISTETIKLIYEQITTAQAVIRQLKSDPKGYDLKYFLNAKAMLKGKLNITSLLPALEKIRSMSQLCHELDLSAPLMGFLEQNQIRKNNKRMDTEFYYEYNRLSVSISRKFDVKHGKKSQQSICKANPFDNALNATDYQSSPTNKRHAIYQLAGSSAVRFVLVDGSFLSHPLERLDGWIAINTNQ